MSLFFSLSPLSQQPLGRFKPNLAGRWVLSVPLRILEIKMICHMVRISYNKKKAFGGVFQHFRRLFFTNRLTDADQTWQKGGNC